MESQTGATARSIQLYAGQSTECSLTLINTSPVPVECFDLELVQPIRSSSNQVFSFRYLHLLYSIIIEQIILFSFILT